MEKKVIDSLIGKCKEGDRRAQNKLYEQCYGILMSICLRYEKNREDARHVMNLGFMKIVTNLDKIPSGVSFEIWMRRVMINTNIDEYRKNKNRKEHIRYSDLEADVDAWRGFDTNEALHRLNAEELEIMIRNLPEEMQKVFNLYAIDGYSHKEIGEMLGMPEGTSKWHVSKARGILREQVLKKLEKSKARIL